MSIVAAAIAPNIAALKECVRNSELTKIDVEKVKWYFRKTVFLYIQIER